MTDGPVTSTRESTETLEAMADQLRRDAEPAFPLAETRIGIDVVQGLVDEVLEARRTPGGTNAVEHLLDVARQDRDDVELKLGKAYEELGTARDLVEHYKGIQAELLRQAQVLQGRLNEEFAAAELYQAQRNELSERLSVMQDERDMQAAARQSETNRANEEHRKAEQWRRLLQAQITEAKALATRMLNAEAAAREAQSRLSAKADSWEAMQRRAEAAEEERDAVIRRAEAAEADMDDDGPSDDRILLDRIRIEVDDLRAELADTTTERDALHAQRDEARRQVAAEVEAKKALTRRGEAAERKVAELEQSRNFLGRECQQAHRDRDDLAHQLSTTIASLGIARENAKQSDERVAVLDAELNRVRGERDAEEDAHTYEREQTARLRDERDELRRQLLDARNQLRDLRADADEAVSRQRDELSRRGDELSASLAERDLLITQRNQAQEMLAETMNELAALQRGEDPAVTSAKVERLERKLDEAQQRIGDECERRQNLRIAIAAAIGQDGA